MSDWAYAANDKADDGTLIYNDDATPLQQTKCAFDENFQLSYSKEGVCSVCYTTGTISPKSTMVAVASYYEGVEEGAEGVEAKEAITKNTRQVILRVTSSWGREILNGQDVAMTASISEDYALSDEDQILAYGLSELYKTIQNAKGATWRSDRIPLKVEPGMTLVGESSLYGTINLYVTSMSRTTDAQQGTITTSITGTIEYSGASSEVIDLDSNESMGWL
jgi:hypothetical protein